MSNIFRDPTEGASARRADLLRRRRDELVMMPHAIRRVYVARRARTAASLAIALLGAAMVVVAMQPAWTQFLARGLPGINPAVLCTLVVAMWIVGLFTYVAARALDEHRFAVAMSRFVTPGKDVNEDLERLTHEHPDQAARDMAHRLEVRSAALPVLAAGVLVPVTALYIAAAVRTGGWPVVAELEASVALHAKMLAACASLGALTAIVMTKRSMRLPGVAPLTGALALVTASFSIWLTPSLLPVALIIACVALVVRKLRIERDLLQAEDPAAGSEVFTLRGFIKQLRASAAPVVARVRSVKPIWVLVTGLLVIAGMTAMKLLEVREPQIVVTPTEITYTPSQAAMPPTHLGPSGSKTTVTPIGDGRLLVEIHLVDGQPVEIPSVAGVTSVPALWEAHVTVQQTEGMPLEVASFAFEAMQTVSIGSSPVTMRRASCGMEVEPLTLRVQGAPGHYVLYVAPVLKPAKC